MGHRGLDLRLEYDLWVVGLQNLHARQRCVHDQRRRLPLLANGGNAVMSDQAFAVAVLVEYEAPRDGNVWSADEFAGSAPNGNHTSGAPDRRSALGRPLDLVRRHAGPDF